MAQLSHPNTQSATPSLPNPGFVSANEMLAFADFLERIKPVIEYVEAHKATLPPPLPTLVESDAECDLTPSEVMQLLKQANLPQDILDDMTALAEEAERSMKWEQECKAFLERVKVATVPPN